MAKNVINPGDAFRTARLKLGDGWRALVALEGPEGMEFTPADWRLCLRSPEKLLADCEDKLKGDGLNSVFVKTLRIGTKDIRVVIKSQQTGGGVKDFFRSMAPARSRRNFNTARKLLLAGVATPHPLAALEKRKGLRTVWSLYLYRHVEAEANLYYFVRDHLPRIDKHDLTARRRIACQLAQILAGLHRAGFWHRDAKSSNFLIERTVTGDLRTIIVDLDGIKRYRLKRRHNQFRSLVKLASTVLAHPAINRTDYLRTFAVYSRLSGPDKMQGRRIFRELVRQSVAVRLLATAISAMEGNAATGKK